MLPRQINTPGMAADRKFKRPFHAAPPAPHAPAAPAGPAAPRALARRPRPPARPAARRHAVAHGLDRHRCWGGGYSSQRDLLFPERPGPLVAVVLSEFHHYLLSFLRIEVRDLSTEADRLSLQSGVHLQIDTSSHGDKDR